MLIFFLGGNSLGDTQVPLISASGCLNQWLFFPLVSAEVQTVLRELLLCLGSLVSSSHMIHESGHLVCILSSLLNPSSSLSMDLSLTPSPLTLWGFRNSRNHIQIRPLWTALSPVCRDPFQPLPLPPNLPTILATLALDRTHRHADCKSTLRGWEPFAGHLLSNKVQDRTVLKYPQNYQRVTVRKSFFFNFLFCIGVELINNVVIVSGVQPSDSVTHIHVSILFQILFPFRQLHNIEQNSLCYTVGPVGYPF